MNEKIDYYLECIRIIRRIGWRIQYRTKVITHRELLIRDDLMNTMKAQEPNVILKIFIDEMLEKIPSVKGREIIRKLYLDGFTESEVSRQLNITQQAVNKWKKKSLEKMREHLRQFSA